MATATTWISRANGRAGGDACVRDTRITIWGLEAFRRSGMSDAEIMAAVQGLTTGDLEAAWDYVAAHSSEIDETIRANEVGEEGLLSWADMHFYADEDFAYPVVEKLRRLGHDVLTVQEDGKQGTSDRVVLTIAHSCNRVVLTYNRRHFEKLHRSDQPHSGIVSCTHDIDFPAQAAWIHDAVIKLSVGRWWLRVNRNSWLNTTNDQSCTP
jgi:uncharacterized protein (DUF433 family)